MSLFVVGIVIFYCFVMFFFDIFMCCILGCWCVVLLFVCILCFIK